MNIYVGNVPYASTETDLKELFEEYGPIATVTIIWDRDKDRSKGFGFVEMENQEDGERAIEALDGQEMMGRPLKVNEARPREQRREPRRNDNERKRDNRSPRTTSPNTRSLPDGRFHNPYTFVSTPPREKAIKQGGFAGDFNPLEKGLDHASLKKDLWTGHIPIKITTVTPLVLLKGDGRKEDPTEPYDVHDRIPESSLRGMLRSAYEVVTNSRYGCFRNNDRLAYRMGTDEATKLIPAIIKNGGRQGTLKVCLYPGTSHATNEGPDGARELGATYAAMLTCYSNHAFQQSRYVIDYIPKTGDEVWAEIVLCQHQVSPRYKDHWLKDYRFWKVVMVWPKVGHPRAPAPTNGNPWFSSRQAPDPNRRQSYYAPLNPEDRRVVPGHVLVTNQNMGNKHDERIFFDPIPSTMLNFNLTETLTEALKEAWRMRIKSYRGAHSNSDFFNRPGAVNKPWKYISNKPGKTAWSPHQYQDSNHRNIWQSDRHVRSTTHDAIELKDGDMAYACCKIDDKTGDIKEVFDLFPVMISRELYENSPEDLLDESLRPAEKLEDLSPADRLFGWTPQGQGSDGGYKSRVRVVCEDGECVDRLETFENDPVPLTILGQPKPEQGRFYVAADDKGTPQDGESKQDAGYDKNSNKQLRGRKHYWHHKGLETENDKAKKYWDPFAENPKQNREYIRTGRIEDRTGRIEDSQNRNIKGWIKPNKEFKAFLYLQNLEKKEIGALLWLLWLPEDHYFRLGYGKPLGFGSVKIEVDTEQLENGCLPVGSDKNWKAYYADINACSPAKLDANMQTKCIQEFQDSMTKVYDEQDFNKLPFIEGFLQVLRGPDSSDPIHYPRRKPKPDPDGKNYEWFMDNENGRERNQDGMKIALPKVTDNKGLPYNPSKPKPRRGGQ